MQPGARHLRTIKVQCLQMLHAGQLLQSGIAEFRVCQRKAERARRLRQLRQPGDHSRPPAPELNGGNISFLVVDVRLKIGMAVKVIADPAGPGARLLPGGNDVRGQGSRLLLLRQCRGGADETCGQRQHAYSTHRMPPSRTGFRWLSYLGLIYAARGEQWNFLYGSGKESKGEVAALHPRYILPAAWATSSRRRRFVDLGHSRRTQYRLEVPHLDRRVFT